MAGLDGLAVYKKKIARREAQAEVCNLKASYSLGGRLALALFFELLLSVFNKSEDIPV